MTIELYGRKGITVRSKSWAPNTPQILEVDHAVKVDSSEVLEPGTAVMYTDPDLGVQFVGKIISRGKTYKAGEGVTYTCADKFRTLIKTPAVLRFGASAYRSAKIQFPQGTLIHDAIDAVLSDIPSNLFPGGIDKTYLPNTALPVMDKTGQSIDSWLEDIIVKTPGGVVWVDSNDGSPKLVFADFYNRPATTLKVGSYQILKPTTDGEPVMESAGVTSTSNRKYKKVSIEGCGIYQRFVNRNLPITVVAANADAGFAALRVYFPESKVGTRAIHSNGTCFDYKAMTIVVGKPTDDIQYARTLVDFVVLYDEDGRPYTQLNVFWGGATSNPSGYIPMPSIEVYLTYTGWLGPLIASVESSDPALEDEGELWEIHESYFKYISDAINIDHTDDLSFIAEGLFNRFSNVPDNAGSVQVHVKGLYPNISPGSVITNPEFNGARIRSIRYDYVRRSMSLEVSDVPLRDETGAQKQLALDLTLKRNLYYQTRGKATIGCFDDCVLVSNSGGNSNNTRPSKDRKVARKWHCVIADCIQNEDGGGKFDTLADCQQQCPEAGAFDFFKCKGCMDSAGGQYLTMAECKADNPGDPMDDPTCGYDCKQDQGCVQAANPDYATLAECAEKCAGGATGSGKTNSGSGPYGAPSSGQSGPTGKTCDVTVVCSVKLVGGYSGYTLEVKTRTMKFSKGLIIDCGTCT